MRNYKSRVVTGCLLAIVLLLISSLSLKSDVEAQPVPGDDQKVLHSLRELIAQTPEKRVFPEGHIKQLIQTAQGTDLLLQLGAIHVLAFANDKQSLSVLATLAEENVKERNQDLGLYYASMEVRGTAAYALLIREISGMDHQKAFETLRSRILESKNPVERMFISNRLAVDFPNQALPVIYKAAQYESQEVLRLRESDPITAAFSSLARIDMLYYLAQCHDVEILKDIATWTPKPGQNARDSRMPLYYVQLMNALTPGRSDNEDVNSWAALQRIVRDKLDKKIN